MVRYDEPRPELSVRADSACGLLLPIRRRGELFGLLAIESTRRRDFPEPLAPMMATTSPSHTAMSDERSATTDPYDFETPVADNRGTVDRLPTCDSCPLVPIRLSL